MRGLIITVDVVTAIYVAVIAYLLMTGVENLERKNAMLRAAVIMTSLAVAMTLYFLR